ncbi:MAG: hypothetical protein NVSMB9_35640 [Isosphaeraceae bacterium]
MMAEIMARSRSLRRTLGVAFALSVTLAGAPAEAAVPSLKWKFKAGESLHYQMDQKTTTQMKTEGQDIKTTLTQTIETTWSVQSVNPEGTAEMIQSIDRVKTKIESPFGAIEYDSKADKAPQGAIAAGVVPILKALVGSKFQYKISPQGELTDVKVPEGLVKALKEAGPAGAAGSNMFSEEGLRNMIRESSLVFPASEIDKPWTRQSKLPLPPIGTMTLDKTYNYEGPSGNQEKIGLKVNARLEAAPDSQFQVKLGPQEGKGNFSFDNKAGRVVQSDVSEMIEMLITFQDKTVSQKTDTSTSMKLLPGEATPPK